MKKQNSISCPGGRPALIPNKLATYRRLFPRNGKVLWGPALARISFKTPVMPQGVCNNSRMSMQKQNSTSCPGGRPSPRIGYLALYSKRFFETQSYPWYGIGHLSIIRGAGSLGIPISLQGKLCSSRGGLVIEEQLALQQQRLNFLKTPRCP